MPRIAPRIKPPLGGESSEVGCPGAGVCYLFRKRDGGWKGEGGGGEGEGEGELGADACCVWVGVSLVGGYEKRVREERMRLG